jgi:hypothetical protein
MYLLNRYLNAPRYRKPKVEASLKGGYKPWAMRNGFFLRLAFVPGYWLKDDFYRRRTPVSYYAGMFGDRRVQFELRKASPRD